MESGRPESSLGLPGTAPVPCEKCGGVAMLVSSRIDAFSRGLKETLTYECGTCGHKTSRTLER